MTLVRTGIWVVFLATWIADCTTMLGVAPARPGSQLSRTIQDLTLWSWTLHTACFLPFAPSSYWTLLTYGPSFGGAWALMLMYIWTMIANPTMELDLAPPGRPVEVIWARAVLLHFGPPLLHMLYLAVYKKEISAAYRGRTSLLLKFWSAVAGYLAMGLMWEQVIGNAAANYKVTWVSNEVFVNVSKVLGVSGATVSYYLVIAPWMAEGKPGAKKSGAGSGAKKPVKSAKAK